MKITASKISAIVFSIIAVAAFAWMIMRPSIDAQAAGFGLSSNSSSAGTTATAPPKDTDASSEAETTDKDSTTNSTTEEKDTEKSEKESDEKAEEKSADDKTSDEAKQDTDSSADTAKPSASDASKQSNKEQSAEPTTPEAPTAPTSPVAPSTSDSTDDQTDNKKKDDPEKQPAEKTSQTDGIEATDSTVKTEESDQKAETAVAATAAVAATVATAVVAQDKQPTETDEANSSEIYTQADNARGTVVILSDCDYKPNTEGGIVTTLHKSLPQKGWNTLSFQLPNLSTSSTFKDLEAIMPEAAKNIESSIAMAKEKSDTPVALLAHGCGSQMALAWMEVKGNDSIDAYIGLGSGIMNSDPKDTDHLRIPLEAMKFPQLDIFGSADHAAVLKTAAERLGHINRASNPASRQKIILDADHNMTGKEDVLASVIAKWLDKKAFKK